ncbi:T9SS type A sorting domain-containing protein [Hymenobacter aerilatus]|uniref:T9SS type A sorting domain-containing protein n=1 Tax=Hymenobacter aerilatus TaxID=2932251 RepID=A0A8T9SYC3_9BACT|nr:T9SS type A sorting domain-containing protein [Hymenobacter aerilatus]UOR05200.1 T9SS type A sorting domain-containing protein [Hymenobacter aerilatus]
MKKLLLFSFLLIAAVAPSFGQQLVKYVGPGVPDTCYASYKAVRTRIPPPAAFLANRPLGTKATITVTYTGFTPEAQAAFQYAVDIWQSLLVTNVPIRISATWRPLDAGVLGSAGPSGLYQLAGYGERISNSLYPTALAEKIVGADINGSGAADINASFSSTFNWYLGTDGLTPAGQYDLVSVVLHELGHGLGFLTSKGYDVNSKQGSLSTPPSIYADFMKTGAGLSVADTRIFVNPSVELGTAFTTNDLYFDSPLTRASNNGERARLYAPTEYASGSSLSHLDENTYSAGDINSLMSPQFAPGEAIHSPGPIVLAMFNEMGWFNTAIDHTPYTDTETPRTFPVTVRLRSDGTVTPGSVKLNYAFNNGALTTVTMTPTGTTNQYTATIPNPGSGVRVSYYVEASDNETRRIYTAPGRDAFSTVSNRYSFFVGPDVVPPTLSHTPPAYLFTSNLPYTITAQAADNIGVASVTLEYNVNGTVRPSITLTRGTGNSINTYTGVLSTAAGPIVAGDVINYRIVAQDNSSNANRTALPATGFYAVPVVDVRPAADMYANEFERTTPIDFVGPGFSIATPTGFTNGAIHSTHPYVNNVNYFYRLLVPIRVKADPQIARVRFDEIVLVEPGEEGSVFPAPNFFDYVVVEGSLDGTTWTPLAPGYDARNNANWLDLYNRALSGENSAAVGTPSIYASRTISLLDKFKAGDVVQLRFRLYADGGAYGWGWAIDNLHIQDNTVTPTAQALQGAGVSVFPNPTAGQFTVQTRFDKPVANLEVVVRNALGQEVLRQSQTAVKGQVSLPLDLNKCANGFYLVSLTADGETATRKVMLSK